MVKEMLSVEALEAQTALELPERELPLVFVTLLNGVVVFVPINAAANICDINVNVLAAQVEAGDNTCDAEANQGNRP